MDFTREVSLTAWRSPAKTGMIFARAATHIGEVVLVRGPSAHPTALSAAEGREEWTISLPEAVSMKIAEFGAPGVVSARILKSGTLGELNGVPFEIRTVSSFRKSSRKVLFDGLGIVFVTRGLRIYACQDGVDIASRFAGRWETSVLSPTGIVSLCLFEWGEMAHFLRTPFMRLL